MSNFATAMQDKKEYTRNGAISIAKPDPTNECNGRISLFFKAIRTLNIPTLHQYIREAVTEDVDDTFILAFNIRDCRGGKGERLLGRYTLIWLFLNYPEKFIKIAQHIAFYGRWDDLLYLWPKVLDLEEGVDTESTLLKIRLINKNHNCDILGSVELSIIRSYQLEIVKIMGNQLIADLSLMQNGKSITLCAKWAPTQKDSLDFKHQTVNTICTTMKWSYKEYRTKYTSPSRLYLKIVERFMCSNSWDDIDYSKVPSCAMKKLKTSFEKHSPDTFMDWKTKLNKGEVSINAKQLFPHEIIYELKQNGSLSTIILEAQWKVLEDETDKLGVLKDTLCVVDTSGSMGSWGFHVRGTKLPTFTPMDVSIALGLLISNSVKGVFHNHVITFHSDPTFQVLNDSTLEQRFRTIRDIPWGGSTNIQGTFDLILNKAKQHKLKPEDMPKKILILSDMQFNIAEGYSKNSKTNFKVIEEKYASYGYQRPSIIFWNIAANIGDFPVTVDQNNTAMVAGFTTSILRALLKQDKFTSLSIMREVLDSDRYKPLRDSLSD
jgi:hypothetical protein